MTVPLRNSKNMEPLDDPPRCTSPASTISEVEHSAGNDNSLLTATPTLLSGVNDSILEEALLAALRDPSLHWVRVSRLDPATTEDSLRDIFYHYGANDAFLLHTEPGGRRVGAVSFGYPEMATLAVEKVNHFVPRRQSAPLVVDHVSAKLILGQYRVSHSVENQVADPLGEVQEFLTEAFRGTTCSPQSVAAAIQSLQTEMQVIVRGIVASTALLSALQRMNVATGICLACQSWSRSKAFMEELVDQLSREREQSHAAELLNHVESCWRLAPSASPSGSVRPVAPSPLTRKRADEACQRTVYVSRIPNEATPARFFRDVIPFGTVLKVRMCRARGANESQFAFVEYSSSESASLACMAARSTFFSGVLRVQPAKTPIQDTSPTDAVVGADGMLIRPCSFGTLP